MKRIALFPLLIVSLAACDLLGGDDPGSDPNKPSVTSLSPENGAQDVPLSATMSATLELPNTGIDATTLGNGTVRLTQAGEDVPVATEDPVLAGDTITLRPSEPLEPGASYTFTLTTGIKDLSNQPLAKTSSSTFTTVSGGGVEPEPTAELEASAERLIFEAQDGQTSAAQTLTIRNVGDAAFSLSSLEPSTDQFALAGLPTLPTTIEQGGSVEVQITFAPTSTGPKDATLTVNGDAPLEAELRGLGVKGDGGNDEPSLQWIFDTFDLNLETGDDDASSTPIANNPSNEALNGLLGNEIKAPSFQKAGTGDVTIEVLAAYGVDNNPVAEFGWYEADNADARNALFDVESGADNAQTLNPEVDGELSFDPESASFGFYSFWPTNEFFDERYVYTQDELNTFEDAIPHQVRVYPLPGEANAYVLATEEFTQGFDYNDIVVIVRNVKPASLACNQVETILSSRSDLPSMNVGSLELQNLAGAPFADRLVFSRIGDISQETFGDDREPFPFASLKCHDRNTLRLNNEGGSTISVSDITITGAASGAFVLPNGESSFDISAGDSKDLVVQFTESSGEKGLREATLELQTSAGQVEVELAGIYQKAPEGSREIYLEGVVEAFGYSTDIGANNQGGLSSAEPPGDANFDRAGDEVISRLWRRVDTSKPVYIRQLAAFHSCCSESSNDSLEVRVNGSTIGEFVHAAPYGQAVLPPVEGDLDKAAELSVQPSGPFELVVRDGYSTDWVEGDKNNNNLGVRLWPAERDGSTAGLENSYIVAQDFVENGCGTSETANCDFNDNMYLITNVSPVSTQ